MIDLKKCPEFGPLDPELLMKSITMGYNALNKMAHPSFSDRMRDDVERSLYASTARQFMADAARQGGYDLLDPPASFNDWADQVVEVETTEIDRDCPNLSNPDAMNWAESFVKVMKQEGWSTRDIDEGLMVSWFSNYWAAVHDPLQSIIDLLESQVVDSERKRTKAIDDFALHVNDRIEEKAALLETISILREQVHALRLDLDVSEKSNGVKNVRLKKLLSEIARQFPVFDDVRG